MAIGVRHIAHYICRAGLPGASGALFSGPYRSLRELSLAGLVGSVTRCPPTCVGNPGSMLQRPARLRTLLHALRALTCPVTLRCSPKRASKGDARAAILRGSLRSHLRMTEKREPSRKQKAELRAAAQARRDALPPTRARPPPRRSRRGRFRSRSRRASIVSGFMPMKSEINPLPLMQKLAEAGARLALPAVAGRGKPLIMRAWALGEPLDRGQWGIREPKAEAPEVEPDILLVPLLAFDRSRPSHRLRRRLLRHDHRAAARAQAGDRRRRCLRRPGGCQSSRDGARRAARSRANRARSDRSARRVSMRILFVGDVVGRSGRTVVIERLPGLIRDWKLDLVVVNGENAAGGFGITETIYREFVDAGADAITLGNHAWDQKEALVFIERAPKLIRPINYPAGTPGRGAAMIEAKNGARALVINAMGRIFMDPLDDPFAAVERELAACPLRHRRRRHHRRHARRGDQRKAGDGLFLRRPRQPRGRHPHPRADGRSAHLAGGTAFMSDVGMTGDYNSVIGMAKDEPLQRFLRRISTSRFEPATGAATLCAVAVETDAGDRACDARRRGAARRLSGAGEAGILELNFWPRPRLYLCAAPTL